MNSTATSSLFSEILMDDEVLQWWGLKAGGGDPITSKWPGVGSVTIPLVTIFLYLVCVSSAYLRMGPRQPPKYMNQFLLIYNFFQVAFSSYIFCETVITAWNEEYNIMCEPYHSTRSLNGHRMAMASWLFYVSKYIDLLDTAFILIKGNKRQISLLHVFHHSTMVLNSWMGIRHAPTGHSFFIHLANSFVHVCMYSYYFLSALGPRVRPYLWWKPYLTQMQIIQFFLMFGHMMIGFYNDCPLPGPLVKTVLIYLAVLTCLFMNFYVQNYMTNAAKAKLEKKLQ